MRILFAASEVSPFAKTGGLADVAGSLPRALAALGHDVRIAMPLYKAVDRYKHRLLPLMPEMVVQYGDERLVGEVMRCSYPCDQELPVYFLMQDMLFHREGLYGEFGGSFDDNDRRFAYFCFATLWLLKGLDWQPEIIHLNDWQTGLIAPLLKHHHVIANDEFYKPIRSVFSIHNLAYQGLFPGDLMPRVQLPWDIFTQDGMEFHGKVGLLKAGLVYSDYLLTVSPNYAAEIQTEEFGCGLDGLLRHRASELKGILNGVDGKVWNPSTDKLLPACYSAGDMRGKKTCRAALLSKFKLTASTKEPVFGMVSRLVEQKGHDIMLEAIPQLLQSGARFILVGTGDKNYQESYRKLAQENPNQVGVVLQDDETLAHLVEAGSDMFLMPSQFEPSGLNQLYSMAYGSIPIVRKVGGLADSVTHATSASIRRGRGTGFVFNDFSARALMAAVTNALTLFQEDPESWDRLVKNAMSQDFSWDASAREYEKVYREVLSA